MYVEQRPFYYYGFLIWMDFCGFFEIVKMRATTFRQKNQLKMAEISPTKVMLLASLV